MKAAVARKIKAIRTEIGMSQTELANKCNVSKSLISKVEANKATMHLDLLMDIASALDVSIFDLLEGYQDKKQKAAVVKVNERKKLVAGVPGKTGYRYYRLASSNEIGAFILYVSKDALKMPRFVVHEGFEFLYIMEGKVKLHFRDEEYLLSPGDTAFFNGTVDHKIVPFECEFAQMIIVFVHPTNNQRN